QAELACDGWVIAALPNGRRAYAESLLALSSAATAGEPPSPMTAVFGVRARSRRALERRLVMVIEGSASRPPAPRARHTKMILLCVMRASSSAPLALAGLFGFGFLALAALPVWSAG